MPKREIPNTQSEALEKVTHDFAAWRKTKTGRARIPEPLWAAAADLHHSFGLSVNKIAKSLRLNYSTLKTHIFQEQPSAIESVEKSSATFIEVESVPPYSDCIIEMEQPSGVKMRMCFRGRVDPDALELGRYFLEDRP
jgi:hypothetical protein